MKPNQHFPARKSSRRRGAALIEAAAVFVLIVLPLSFAVLQFGFFYNATNSLTQIARDGARFAAVYAVASDDPTTTTVDESSDTFILNHIRDTAQKSSVHYNDLTSVTISPPLRSDRSQYSQVTVTVQYDLNKRAFFPFLNVGLFRPGITTRSAVAMIE